MALTDNMRGALFMMGSMTAFTINDAFMKALSTDLPLFQAIFIRSLGVCLLLSVMAWRRGLLRLSLSPVDARLLVLRTFFEIVAAFLFISALFNMPLANATAILQALPLTVTLAGALFLAEPVGWRRILAIMIGFLGVMMIVQPGGDGFTIYSVYVLGAVACITVRDLAARRMSRGLPSLTVALVTALAVGFSAGVMSLNEDWQPVSTANWLALAGAGGFIIGGYIFSVAAMRVGEIGAVAQFRYTGILVALILGLVVFGEWPDTLTLAGTALVVATGLFTLWRERKTAAG